MEEAITYNLSITLISKLFTVSLCRSLFLTLWLKLFANAISKQIPLRNCTYATGSVSKFTRLHSQENNATLSLTLLVRSQVHISHFSSQEFYDPQ